VKWGRRAEQAGLFLVFLAAVLHVVAASGGPTWPRLVALLAASLCAALATVFEGAGWLDRWRLPLVLLLLSQLPEVDPKLRGPDGFEYYMLARSPLFDHDLDLANDYRGFQSYGQYSSTGRLVSRTPCGLAILWTPVIIVAHAGTLVARGLGAPVAADGFSMPYQAAVTLASFFFGVVALLLAEAFVRRLYGPAVAFLVAFALWAGTPLAFYSVVMPLPHSASALAVAVFLIVWLRHRESTHDRDWLRLGFLGGLMALVRIQDGVLVVIPLLDLLLSRRPGRLRQVTAFLVGPGLAGALQALVWARLFGPDFLREAAGVNLFGGVFHPVEILFSPHHGVFTWTPLWLLGAIGWLLLLRRDPRLGALVLLSFTLVVFVNASIEDWWGGISFGHRRFLGLTLLFGLGLGELFDFLGRRPRLTLGCAVAGLVLWNQQFTFIFTRRQVAGRDDPVTLDRLAGAQVDRFYRAWLEGEDHLPGWLFAMGYDNLKGIWLDERRSMSGRVDVTVDDPDLPFLIGDGWLTPRVKDGVAFRRSRGPSSSLRVPIYSPGAFRLSVKARSVLRGQEVGVSLSLNGSPVGVAIARPEWSDLRYEIPSSVVRSGLNTLVFTYDVTARILDPETLGLNAAVAVQDLRFERRAPSAP
jgi:hypothetical protein